jgi:hypothetical protein
MLGRNLFGLSPEAKASLLQKLLQARDREWRRRRIGLASGPANPAG